MPAINAMELRKYSSLIICSLLLVLSCQAADIDPEGELRFALGGEVSIINPILSTDSVSSAVEGGIFNSLITFDEKLNVVPDLAKSWKVSKDGKVWTFYLRQDVKWHDGKPFTAEDVKFTFDSILNPKINSVRRSDFIIDGVPVRFKVIDPYTIQANMSKPFAPFLIRMGSNILPKHLLYGKDMNTAEFNRRPVGTGPFIFKEWKVGDQVTLVRNPHYYLGRPLLAKVTYKIIPDENSRLIAFEAGETDETGVPPKDYNRMKAKKNVIIYENDVLLYTYLGFNLANPKFKDKRVRQALAYATDKKQLVSLIHRGLAAPAYAPTAPMSWAYSDKVQKYLYDPAKAKKLLAAAGVKDLEFTVLVNQGNKEREKAAVILQQQFNKVGVKMNIRVLEWSALLKIINVPKDPKEFEAIIMGWSLGLDPDAYSIWHSSQYPKGFNFIKYQNKEADHLLEVGRTTMDKAKRKKIYARLWQVIAADQPYIFLWYPKAVAAISDQVGGLSKPGPAGPFVHIEKVFKKR